MTPYFMQVDGYRVVNQANLPENAVEMLELDDFIFMNYDGPEGRVNLYIGYYYTADKAYAAHSPMVCYAAQGWKIAEKAKKHHLNVGSYEIQYEEIITSYGNQAELVLYWYQADQLTETNAYMNKLKMGYNKVTKDTAQHAFVRVAVPIGNGSYENAKKSGVDFIRAFYPNLVEFIKSNTVESL
ncbi:hypothetical protein D3OALGB2SA_2649 [Olavius algarvensis associated proteobacterium Delta 3]|nr:hypothetical protein D3OALGB2SA_2649 [Olavius algarvensis associated proteobacterium Delta 3]